MALAKLVRILTSAVPSGEAEESTVLQVRTPPQPHNASAATNTISRLLLRTEHVGEEAVGSGDSGGEFAEPDVGGEDVDSFAVVGPEFSAF